MFIESDMLFFVCVVKISMCEENYIITQQNSNINTTFYGGTSCDVWINSSVAILRINASNVTASTNDVLSTIELPSAISIASNAEAHIVVPILSTSWIPNGQIAYLFFNGDTYSKSPRIRVTNSASVSGVVLQGNFAFPRNYFTVS